MGLLGNVVSSQLEKRQNVTSQAVQLQNYCTEHEQELKEGCEGGRFVMLDSSDVWGEFIMASDQKAIANRLGMDSDGWFTIMANHTQLIMRWEAMAGIIVRGCSGSKSGSLSSSMDEGENIVQDQQDKKKVEEEEAIDKRKDIESMPFDNENVVQQIKDCILQASRNEFSTKSANKIVKDAWKEREDKLRRYADVKCASDPEYVEFLADENAKKEKAERAAAEKKAKRKAKEEADKKTTNLIIILLIGLSVVGFAVVGILQWLGLIE